MPYKILIRDYAEPSAPLTREGPFETYEQALAECILRCPAIQPHQWRRTRWPHQQRLKNVDVYIFECKK